MKIAHIIFVTPDNREVRLTLDEAKALRTELDKLLGPASHPLERLLPAYPQPGKWDSPKDYLINRTPVNPVPPWTITAGEPVA
jgi:hypothetical protein